MNVSFIVPLIPSVPLITIKESQNGRFYLYILGENIMFLDFLLCILDFVFE